MTPLCKCRPGCLAPVRVDDDVTQTPDGIALADHVFGAWPQDELPLFSVAADVAS